MIILDTVGKTLELVLGAPMTTNELVFTASWVDVSASGFVPGSQDGVTNGSTPVTMIPAPAASVQRQVKGFTIFNSDTVDATITVIFNSGTQRKIRTHTLGPNDSTIWNGESFVDYITNAAGANAEISVTAALASGKLYPIMSTVTNGITTSYADPNLDWDIVKKELAMTLLALKYNATPPVAPLSQEVIMFCKKKANRVMPAFIGPAGLDATMQPFVGTNKVAWWNAYGNSASMPRENGILAATTVGTLTLRAVAVTNKLTRARRLGIVSAATAGALASFYFSVAQFTTGTGVGVGDGGFTYVKRFGVSDAAAVAGARCFIGMTSSVAAPTNVEPSTLTNCIGLAQLSTDNTQWYIVYGGSAAQAAIPLGTGLGAPTDNTAFMELAIFASPTKNGEVNYSVTNINTDVMVSGVLTPTTPGVQTPISTTLLSPRAWRCNNATALAVGLDISSMYLETDN